MHTILRFGFRPVNVVKTVTKTPLNFGGPFVAGHLFCKDGWDSCAPVFNMSNGFPANWIASILEDRAGSFWLAGAISILRVTPEDLEKAASSRFPKTGLTSAPGELYSTIWLNILNNWTTHFTRFRIQRGGLF